MGRPQKNAEEVKRILIQFRCTTSEKNTLKDFAKKSGMTITDFVKHRTLEKAPRQKVATPDREVLLLLLSELSKIGSNINQIARAMNAAKQGSYSVAIKDTFLAQIPAELQIISTAILKQLQPENLSSK